MVQEWVKNLVENAVGKSSMKVGAVIKHPDGRTGIRMVSYADG